MSLSHTLISQIHFKRKPVFTYYSLHLSQDKLTPVGVEEHLRTIHLFLQRKRSAFGSENLAKAKKHVKIFF